MTAPLDSPVAAITLGAGLSQPQGKRVTLTEETVGGIADTITGHKGREAWWSPHTWRADRRNKRAWQRSVAVALDLDCALHAILTQGLAVDVTEALRGHVNLLYRTPHGLRAVLVFMAPVAEADAFMTAARGASATVQDALDANGIEGIGIDSGCTEDLARLFFTPCATVKCRHEHPACAGDEERKEEVLVLRTEPWDAKDLADHADVLPLLKVAPARRQRGMSQYASAPDSAYSTNGGAARERAYVRAAFEGEIARVRNAAPGSRNQALNTAAYSLGGYVGAGLLDETEVVDALTVAAKEVGDGEAGEDRKIAGTIRSGLSAGRDEPRMVPEARHDPDAGAGADHDDDGWDYDEAEEIEEEPYRPGPVPEGKSASRLDTVHGERYAAAYDKKLKHVTAWRRWIAWDGKRWRQNANAEALLATKAIVRASDRRCEAIERRRAALACAAVEAPIALDHERLDQRPTLLNLLNGTLDLETGKLRPHDPGDLITQLAPVPFDPTAKAPLFEAFLKRVLPDEDVRLFVQRASGYSLSGLILAHALFFCFGRGANGKSTFLTTFLLLLGDYGLIAPPGLLIVRQGEPHPTEIADLFRRRLVVSHETGEDNRLNEERVKTLTGGDPLRARRMREDFWEFAPTHKLWLASNYQPAVRGTDEGIWRRIFLQPWTVTVPESERDERMPEKLAAELPGILQWALRGWEDYQREGLAPPASVRGATNTYRAKADTIGAFLSLHIEQVPGVRIQAQPLYDAYKAWARQQGLHPQRSNVFSSELTERRGFVRSEISGRRYYLDCRFRPDPSQQPASGGEGPDV